MDYSRDSNNYRGIWRTVWHYDECPIQWYDCDDAGDSGGRPGQTRPNL